MEEIKIGGRGTFGGPSTPAKVAEIPHLKTKVLSIYNDERGRRESVRST